jgi:hypothetical protein
MGLKALDLFFFSMLRRFRYTDAEIEEKQPH